MDAVGLGILERELAADRRVLADAAGKAAERIGETHDGHLEACAYELARFYTVFERMLEGICEAFETISSTMAIGTRDSLPGYPSSFPACVRRSCRKLPSRTCASSRDSAT